VKSGRYVFFLITPDADDDDELDDSDDDDRRDADFDEDENAVGEEEEHAASCELALEYV
jgi:hypothetical protein